MRVGEALPRPTHIDGFLLIRPGTRPGTNGIWNAGAFLRAGPITGGEHALLQIGQHGTGHSEVKTTAWSWKKIEIAFRRYHAISL